MVAIQEKETLIIENLFSFRGKVKQAELDAISQDLENNIKLNGAERSGYPITATYGIEGNLIDVEILIPINKKISSIGNYVYKEKLLITNALLARHVGNPTGLQQTCNELNQYIAENGLVPITVGYNVTRKIDAVNVENTEIDIYVGISPNIL